MKPASRLVLVVLSAATLLALGLIAFSIKAWLRFRENAEIVVAVAAVKQESRPVVLRISGELQPAAQLDVVSRVAGRLTEIKVKTGDYVTAGAVVASVCSGELAERVQLVEAELIATKKQLQETDHQATEADKKFARYTDLFNQDLIARRDVEQAEFQAATARAQLALVHAQIAQQEAMLTQARKLQQLARIVAPISGIVTAALSAGAPVNDTRAIMTIAQVDTLKLVGAVPARYAERVRDGMTAQVAPRQEMAGPRAGKVIRADSNAKIVGADIEIEIRVDNRDRALSLGALVDATVNFAGREQVLTIPKTALLSAAEQHYVFQVVDGRAVRRAVKVDDAGADPVVIRDGLKIDDRVILGRLGEIKEGVRVQSPAQSQ